MIQLEKEFIGSGEVKPSKFKQIKASKKAYIYERTEPEGTIYYEVFKHKESKGGIGMHGINYTARVRYPKSKSFGVWAWCYREIEQAEKKYNELND